MTGIVKMTKMIPYEKIEIINQIEVHIIPAKSPSPCEASRMVTSSKALSMGRPWKRLNYKNTTFHTMKINGIVFVIFTIPIFPIPSINSQ